MTIYETIRLTLGNWHPNCNWQNLRVSV